MRAGIAIGLHHSTNIYEHSKHGELGGYLHSEHLLVIFVFVLLRAKGKKLCFGFVNLEKAFDRVPREVIRWAMHKLGVEEWLVSAVMSMYTGAKQL